MARIIDPSQAEQVGQVLIGAADVDGGPTKEQLAIIGALLRGYFDCDVEVAWLTGIGPGDAASAFTGAADRRRMRELLVLIEFCRHPITEAQVERVEEYADALEESDRGLEMARDLVAQGREAAMADYYRFLQESPFEMVEPSLKDQYRETLAAPDHGLAMRLRALGDCGPGTLGRAYVELYDRNGLTLPGDDPTQPAIFVAHDMCHVIAGYEPVAIDEIGLGAMQLSINDTDTHWMQFLGNLAIHEAGFLTSEDGSILPKEATLNRQGAAPTLAHAFSRGVQCEGDFTMIDHLAIADERLEDVRAHYGVPPREC
jgi:hypothetical protein